MALNIALLDRGFTLAADFLSYLRENSQRNHEQKLAVINAADGSSRIIAAIDDVAHQLDNAVRDIVGQVSEKLEREQWEKIVGQVKAVHFALEFGDKGMLSQALGRIAEQIEYAKNRIGEEKQEWIGPWLMAESIRIVALRELAPSEKALGLVDKEARNFRLNILDVGARYLLAIKNVPWKKISEFVEGQNEEVLALIAKASHNAVSELEEAEESEETEELKISAKTVLNPAAAWPFPTGTKR